MHFKPFSFIFTRIQPRKNHFKMKNENTLNTNIKSLFDEFLTGLTGNCDKIMIDLAGSYCANKL